MLKSLEIYGFKSFADRTLFEFAAGLTGVVGPNGSGKSNVVDALKWILGDQSAKSLRGQEMTDVIFNGSASRKACSYAEAFLTIDNSRRILSVDDVEVVIGRRLYRSGDAEYLINRQPARLKDIRDLLLGTGAGNAAYSIIEQGRVDQILQANPSARRNVFEEAAGVSRFKARRVEAQRKLERVAQNLQRLSDIVDEVEARLNSTRGQAAKAIKYRELSQELKEWWVGLAADDYRVTTAELNELKVRQTETTQSLHELVERQKVCDASTADFERRMSQLDQALRKVERRVAQMREEQASQEASIRFQTGRLQELEIELTRQREQHLVLLRREADGERQLVHDRDVCERLEQESLQRQKLLDTNDDELNTAAEAIRVVLAQAESLRAQSRQLESNIKSHEQAIAAHEAQLAAMTESERRLLEHHREVEQELNLAISLCDDLLRDYEKRQQHVVQLQQQHRQRISAYAELAGRVERQKEKIAAARETRSAALARRSLLEDLELRQEGLGLGVKELLHRARHSRELPWNKIVGSVSDLLDVDLEFAGVIEVALGARAQLVVVRELQPLLDYLNRGLVTLTGRVGFLAVPDRVPSQLIPPQQRGDQLIHLLPPRPTLPELTDQPGVVARADQLVTSEHGITGLAAALLSDTWVVQDLDTAIVLMAQTGGTLRFVTLQGELIEPHGTLSLGSVRSETSLLSRKSELRRIRNDLLRLEREVVTLESEWESLQKEALAGDEQLSLEKQQLDAFGDELSDAMAAWRTADQNVDRLRRESELLTSQREAVHLDLTRIDRLLMQSREQIEQLHDQLQGITIQLQNVEHSLREQQATATTLEQRKAAERLEVFRLSERQQSLRASLERLKEEQHQRQIQTQESARRVDASVRQRTRVELQLLALRARLTEGVLLTEQALAEAAVLHRQKDQLRVERGQTTALEQSLRLQRRELQERQHADEIRARELSQTLATLAERMTEEYQLSLDEIARSAFSAWERWNEARPGHVVAAADGEAAEHQDPGPATLSLYDGQEFAEVRPHIEAHVTRLRRKLKLLGNVNTDSLQDLEQLEQRFVLLSTQLQDLVEAKATLEDIIRRMNQESRRLFTDTFNTIRKNFQHLFRKVFGGGEGDIVLEDPNDVLECGIEITARPPGKELRSLSLLSGGEKTMTAIALIMSIFQAKPSPFCILDEVDAALDEANVDRFTNVMREFQNTTQFIMITHHKRSMMVADMLYGVTMEESGVSKRMSVRFEDIGEDGHFRRTAAA